MRTTLVLPDAVYRELKRRAAERDETLSGLVTEYVRRGLEEETGEAEDLDPLPSYPLGAPEVDVADRDALQRAYDATGGTPDPDDAR